MVVENISFRRFKVRKVNKLTCHMGTISLDPKHFLIFENTSYGIRIHVFYRLLLFVCKIIKVVRTVSVIVMYYKKGLTNRISINFSKNRFYSFVLLDKVTQNNSIKNEQNFTNISSKFHPW